MTDDPTPLPRPLPADRGDVDTERRHPDGRSLDGMDVEALVRFLAEDQQRAVDAVVGAATPLAALVEATTRSLAAGGRLLYLGAGTSGRLGVLDASECPPTFNADPDRILGVIAGGDTALRRSSEGAEDDPDGAVDELDRIGIGEGDVVVGIAAGGTTPWVLGGIEKSKDRGAVTALISCARRSSPSGCDHLVVLATGPEPLAGSTRMAAGTATKIALNTLTTAVFTKLGRVRGDRMIDLRATNEKLHDRCLRILLELFPDLDRADADRRLHAAGDSLRATVEAIETDRAAGA
ncbi:MAG: N-acetylmuramic acid 6-phosphate etherase [Phycisphaerales bacterium]|nr:N-acetylmuramic acid 6-phosphate etherase [Phycisphaerales bacterium]